MSEVSPLDDIQALQREIGEILQRIIPGAQVRFTGFFNNTFFPDGVIEWPEGSGIIARPLYLKTNAHPEWLTEDVLSADMRPTVTICLADITASKEALQPLREALRATGGLLLEESTLRALDVLGNGEPLLRKGVGFHRLRTARV